MQQLELPTYEAGILSRLAVPAGPGLSRAAAAAILTLQFGKADKDRMDTLAAKAQVGKLTRTERSEIEAYSRISSLLGILKSQARRALKSRPANGKAKIV